MSYQLMGSILEVSEGEVLCPGICRGALAYRYEQGTIDGVDVSGVTVAFAADR